LTDFELEKIIWTDHVRNEEVLLRVKEQRNILHEISKWKANWIGHILCRNCFLQQVIEGKIKGGIEVRGRRGRRRRKLLDVLKEGRGYLHLEEEALDLTVWRAGFGPVVRKTAEWMKSVRMKYFGAHYSSKFLAVPTRASKCDSPSVKTIWLVFSSLTPPQL
jgi:hypothetical protein